MEIRKLTERLTTTFRQYKFPLIILSVGLLIMLIPQRSNEPETVISQTQENILTVEQRLCEILSNIAGAGDVRVLLTEISGKEVIYQTNMDNNISNEVTDSRSDTVILTDSERNETGLVRQVNPPIYLGAVVVCEGADNPVVRLSIVEAVSTVTGLGTNKISVLKMG